jgi:tRNA pseudouridine38-40 synthase
MSAKPSSVLRTKSLNLKAIIAYDGTAYVGWQVQDNGISVQSKIEKVLLEIGGEAVILHGASRTDTGVHALGMVATFDWSHSKIGVEELQKGLNALLPEDIRILDLSVAPKKFHARFDAKSKLYRYRILNQSVGDPFRRTTCWFIHRPLDLSSMRKAAKAFVGKHDFSAVATNPGYERTTMVRHIFRCEILKRAEEVHIEVEGDGFLYKMVRTIVGTLVQVGLGRRPWQSVQQLIASRDRSQAGTTAPAHGLCLVQVKYSDTAKAKGKRGGKSSR